MKAYSEEEILTMCDKYIDEKFPNHPSGFNCKKRREIGNIETTKIALGFMGGFKIAMEIYKADLIEIIKK